MKRLVVCVLAAGCVIPMSSSIHRTTALGGAISTGRAGTVAPTSADHDLLVAGLITLTAAYAGTIAGGQFTQHVLFSTFDKSVGGDKTIDKLWIPVYGPWDALIYNESTVRTNCDLATNVINKDCNMVTVASVSVGIGGAAQTTGLILTVAGLLHVQQRPVSKALVVVPHGSGLAVMGSF